MFSRPKAAAHWMTKTGVDHPASEISQEELARLALTARHIRRDVSTEQLSDIQRERLYRRIERMRDMGVVVDSSPSAPRVVGPNHLTVAGILLLGIVLPWLVGRRACSMRRRRTRKG